MFSYSVRWLAANFIAWAQLNADWLSLWLLSHSFFEDSHSRIFNRTVSRRLFDFWESNFRGSRLIKGARRFLNSRDLRLNTKVKWVHRLSNGGEQKTGMGKNILQTTDKFNLSYGFIYFLHIQCPLISWHKIVVLVFNQILINKNFTAKFTGFSFETQINAFLDPGLSKIK